MANQYTHNFKICATCEYWGGNRRFTDSFQKTIEVASAMDRGACYCKNSGWSSTPKQANSTCRSYEAWRALKK